MKSILKVRKSSNEKRLADLEEKVLSLRFDLYHYADNFRQLESLVRKKLKDFPDLQAYDLKIKELRRKFVESMSKEEV